METGEKITILTSITTALINQIATEQNLNYDPLQIDAKMKATCLEWFKEILTQAIKDAKDADMLEGLKVGRIDPSVKYLCQIAITRGCKNYAKFLLGITEPTQAGK